MASHLDPVHPISMHPHPFIHPEANTSSKSTRESDRRATSTSYELDENPTHHDPHPRHPIANSHSSSSDDLESTLQHTLDTDPYSLSTKLKSPTELNLIRAHTSRKRDGFGPITTNRAASKAKALQSFYVAQNENIERWLLPVDEHVRLAKEAESQNHLRVQIGIWGSFAANIVLAGLQVFAAAYSGSLSLFTTMADAIFDPMSNITLMVCARAVKK
ncbi:MAG: hypothetical protein Q9174_003725, partial [Haloplaca sp. 1 TL-2023]